MMWFIPKNKIMIISLTAGLCLSLGIFMTGCKEKESAPPAKPAVVKKRIEQTPQTTVVEAKKTAPTSMETPGAETTATAETAAPKVTEAPASETASPKAEKAAPSVAKTASTQATGPAQEKTAAPQPETVPPEASTVQKTQTEKDTLGETTVETETASLKSSLLEDAFPKYDPTGKIDPFAALFSNESETGLSDNKEPSRPKTPLEKIDISQLKLVAVLLAGSGNRAMVEDATGKPYILTPGIYVGINSGIVTEIMKDRVVIEEKAKDLLGKESARTRELKLQKPFGEE